MDDISRPNYHQISCLRAGPFKSKMINDIKTYISYWVGAKIKTSADIPVYRLIFKTLPIMVKVAQMLHYIIEMELDQEKSNLRK